MLPCRARPSRFHRRAKEPAIHSGNSGNRPWLTRGRLPSGLRQYRDATLPRGIPERALPAIELAPERRQSPAAGQVREMHRRLLLAHDDRFGADAGEQNRYAGAAHQPLVLPVHAEERGGGMGLLPVPDGLGEPCERRLRVAVDAMPVDTQRARHGGGPLPFVAQRRPVEHDADGRQPGTASAGGPRRSRSTTNRGRPRGPTRPCPRRASDSQPRWKTSPGTGRHTRPDLDRRRLPPCSTPSTVRSARARPPRSGGGRA